MKKFNKDDLLNITIEECAEVIQAISKIQRFGWESKHPNQPEGQTNKDHLIEELGDLMCMVGLLITDFELSYPELEAAVKAKLKKLEKWSGYKVPDKVWKQYDHHD